MTTQDIIEAWDNGVEPYRLSKWWQTQSCQDAYERAARKRSERIETMKREVKERRETLDAQIWKLEGEAQ